MTHKDKEREDRILMEAVVDAYDEEERAMGWYYYLEDKISFPFMARCIKVLDNSPLLQGEQVTVEQLAPGDGWSREMFVQIKWNKRMLCVPLVQLHPFEANEQTVEAVEDWHYWMAHGYEF